MRMKRVSGLALAVWILPLVMPLSLRAQEPAKPPAQLKGEVRAPASLERLGLPVARPDCCERTKYGVLVSRFNVEKFDTPFGPGYEVVFDEVIDTKGYNEVRVWVHVFVDSYQTNPVTNAAQLQVRFMHQFPGGSFDYERATLGWNNVTSYINGDAVKPVLGEKLRVLCNPRNLPTGPYDISVTYLLVR
jgi:hypothetical protein